MSFLFPLTQLTMLSWHPWRPFLRITDFLLLYTTTGLPQLSQEKASLVTRSGWRESQPLTAQTEDSNSLLLIIGVQRLRLYLLHQMAVLLSTFRSTFSINNGLGACLDLLLKASYIHRQWVWILAWVFFFILARTVTARLSTRVVPNLELPRQLTSKSDQFSHIYSFKSMTLSYVWKRLPIIERLSFYDTNLLIYLYKV